MPNALFSMKSLVELVHDKTRFGIPNGYWFVVLKCVIFLDYREYQ